MSSLLKRTTAEAIGTFWLVFGGCGSVIIAAKFPDTGIGFLGVAFAFGLTLLTMAYAIGPISGAHLNPAVSVGLACARRFPARDLVPYILAQLAGAIAASGVLYLVASGAPSFSLSNGFATNGYGVYSPGGYSLSSCFLAELVLTGGFLFIILGATGKNVASGFTPIAIGLALTLIHLIDIPITNASVNPARSTGPALVLGRHALAQLWLFWVAPILGAAFVGFLYAALTSPIRSRVTEPSMRPA
jgi:aquaporin Z